MNANLSDDSTRKENEFFQVVWAVVAAFGTYFCMYGFRKPFTAASYSEIYFLVLIIKHFLYQVRCLGTCFQNLSV